MNVRRLYDECWKADVHLIWPATPDSFQRYVRKFDPDYENEEGFAGRCLEFCDDGSQTIVIGLENWNPRDVYSSATLVHECFHATQYILEFRGMKLTDETSEAFAYLLDSLVRRCTKALTPSK